MLRQWGAEACEKTFTTPAVQEMIKNPPHYDLILMEQFNTDCMYGLANLIPAAPVIALSSCAMMPWHYDRMGNPQTPSLTPSLFMGYSDRMDFRERLSNWVGHFGMKALYYLFTDTDANALIKQHIGDGVPDVREMVKRTSMFFVNQHYSLSGAKPLAPSVIELGGIHIQPQKPLQPDLEEFIASAKHGVIYISWGSMVKGETMPEEKLTAIVNALRQFRQKVIWKLDGDVPNKPANVLVAQWLPQRDILCHPNVKVFWTHGGLGGSSEAAVCGTPVVATPFYGDQYLNSAAMKSRGMGTVLPYEELTTENIVRSLKFALKPTTAEAAQRVAYSYNHRPMTQIETAVYWVEQTIATGGAPLMKPSSPFIPWYIYYSLDVYAVTFSTILVLVCSWIWLIKLICRGSRGGGAKKLKKN